MKRHWQHTETDGPACGFNPRMPKKLTAQIDAVRCGACLRSKDYRAAMDRRNAEYIPAKDKARDEE